MVTKVEGTIFQEILDQINSLIATHTALASYNQEVNRQTENPPTQPTSASVYAYGGESTNGFDTVGTIGAEGSFDNPIITVHDLIALYNVRLHIDNFTYAMDSSTELDIWWYYSLDNGSTWILGAVWRSPNNSGDTTEFSPLFVQVDGDTITGNIKIQIRTQRVTGTGNIDITELVGYYKLELK